MAKVPVYCCKSRSIAAVAPKEERLVAVGDADHLFRILSDQTCLVKWSRSPPP